MTPISLPFRRLVTLVIALMMFAQFATIASIEAADAADATSADATSADATSDKEKFFEQSVHPLLAARCYECHSAEKQESGFRLDSRAAILEGGDSGEPGAIAGNPTASRLIKAIHHDGDVQMPPDAKLPDKEIAVLTKWVELGLPWSSSRAVEPALSLAERVTQGRQSHWALQPVRKPALPPMPNPSWAATGVDHLIIAKLLAAGLSPSKQADRRTLIRRLSFDLLGLPPTSEDVDAFVADASPDAYNRLVDRMLASPQYGERWGRHWLDVARYADTKGYAFQKERRYPFAYTYRDYVIAALNGDKPFNEFVVEQLAADQLPSLADPTSLAAMGFLTTGRKFNNRQDDLDDQIDVTTRGLLGLTVACARCHDHKFDVIPTDDYYSLYGVFASSSEPDELPLIGGDTTKTAGYEAFQKELDKLQQAVDQYRTKLHTELLDKSRQQISEYLVRVATTKPESRFGRQSFTFGRDDLKPRLIERWRAYLGNVPSEHPVLGPWKELAGLPQEKFTELSAPIFARLAQKPAGLEKGQLHSTIRAAFAAEPPKSPSDLAKLYGKVLSDAYAEYVKAGGNEDSLAKLTGDQRALVDIVTGKESPTSIAIDDLSNYLSRTERNELRELQKKTESLQASSPAAPPRAMVLKDNSRPDEPRVFIRGNASRPGKTVPRQFLALLETDRQPFKQGSGRLELANRIVADNNPLTSRVIANRIWMHHFGQSLVRTPSDFGVRCEKPLQSELLDYLAATLLENHWSMKALHREIVLSKTYQQESSHIALPNDTHSVALSVGQVSAVADPILVDPENRLYWRMNRQRLEFEPLRDSVLAVSDQLDSTMGGRPVSLTTAPFARRRGVYGFIDRQDLPNLFRVFDFPSPDQSQAERPRTTVPQQALYLMNSPFIIEQSKALAGRPEVKNTAGVDGKTKALYRIVFQREPTAEEMQIAAEFVKDSESDAAGSLAPWERFAQLLLMSNEVAFVD